MIRIVLGYEWLDGQVNRVNGVIDSAVIWRNDPLPLALIAFVMVVEYERDWHDVKDDVEVSWEHDLPEGGPCLLNEIGPPQIIDCPKQIAQAEHYHDYLQSFLLSLKCVFLVLGNLPMLC